MSWFNTLRADGGTRGRMSLAQVLELIVRAPLPFR